MSYWSIVNNKIKNIIVVQICDHVLLKVGFVFNKVEIPNIYWRMVLFFKGSSGSCTENSNDRRQRMSLLLSCIICKEKLRNPISFLCFHSICKKCFEGIIRQQQSENCKSRGDIMLRCPSCDYQTSLYVIKLKKRRTESSLY